VFGGAHEYNVFSQFMRREVRAIEADRRTIASARNPQSHDMFDTGSGDIKNTIIDAIKGRAYAGNTGAVSSVIRSTNRLANGIGSDAQNAMLRIFNGDGTDLEAGIASAAAARAARKKKYLEASRSSGRLAGGAVSSFVGLGE
jgi:hypothetical protein